METVFQERQSFGRFYYRFPNGEAGTDVWALRQGAIAVTPLRAVVAEADGSELGAGFRV